MPRRTILSLLSALVLAIIILAIWYFLDKAQGDQATLFPQEGSVAVKRAFNTVSLPPPQVLKVGKDDEIQTGANSRALVVFLPGASAELGSDTEVTVNRLSLSDDSPPVVELEVQRGDTWHELSSMSADARVEVLTPSARVTLSPAWHHVTVSDDRSTRVEVWQGLAKVKAQNTEVEVRSGEYSSVPSGRAPSVPRPIVARSLFVSEREGNADVWLLDEEGRGFQLTHNQADDLAPVWSPDGTKIAFESLRDGNSEIYVMNSDGSEQVNLTRNSAQDHAPSWSPDGTRIAFESLRDGGRDIYMMNADGSSIGFQTRCYRLTFGPGLNVAPRWSADGQGMVFSRIDRDTNLDGLTDLRDMGAFFFLDDEGGTAQRVWGNRMIFEQTIFPWGRGMVG